LRDRLDDAVDVDRVAGVQRLAGDGSAALTKILGAAGLGGNLVVLHQPAEDLVEHGVADVVDLDLGLDAPQERLVGEVARVQVGREDDHQLEGNLELHAGGQGEVVDATVERNDPAVEQLARRKHLAAEVVDDED